MRLRMGMARVGCWFLILLAIGCGGGGGDGDGGGGDPVDIGGTTYNAALSVGDLFTYQLNTTTLQYRAACVEGIHLGETASGALIPQSGWGTYVYETDDGDTVVLLPGKLVFVHTAAGELLAGVPRLSSTYAVADLVGLYNYVYFEPGAGAATDHADMGTFRLDADGTYHIWEGRDGAADPNNPDGSGTWLDQGNGILRASEGGTPTANVMIHPSAMGNILVLDVLVDGGMAIGLEQQALTSGSYDGTYDVLDTGAAGLYPVTVAGTNVTDPGGTYTVQYNWPWTGFAGNPSDPDGTGAALTSGDGTWFGVFFNHMDADDDTLFAGIER